MAIPECSRASVKFSKGTQALYKLLGFNDKNENGIIEKPSIWNLWTANEGYKEEVDINKDGKITETEVKYYIRNIKKISPEEEQMLVNNINNKTSEPSIPETKENISTYYADAVKHDDLGVIYNKLGKLEDAKNEFTKAISQFDKTVCLTNKYKAIIPKYKEAVQFTNLSCANAHLLLGMNYIHQGKGENAGDLNPMLIMLGEQEIETAYRINPMLMKLNEQK